MSQSNTGKKEIALRGKLTLAVIIGTLSLSLTFFQNCSGNNVAFNDDGKPVNVHNVDSQVNPPTVGDIEPDLIPGPAPDPNPVEPDPVHCVEGKSLGVWLDPSGSGEILERNYLGAFVSYSGEESMVANYNYYSYSTHPLHGPTPIGFHLNVFFYEGSDGLAMNLFSNVDRGGSHHNIVELDILTTGNNHRDQVLLSDDRGEMNITGETPDSNLYEGRFEYWKNSDGAVIGPFQNSEYKIQVRLLETGDINSARFYSADGQSFALENSEGISSFIIAHRGYRNCN